VWFMQNWRSQRLRNVKATRCASSSVPLSPRSSQWNRGSIPVWSQTVISLAGHGLDRLVDTLRIRVKLHVSMYLTYACCLLLVSYSVFFRSHLPAARQHLPSHPSLISTNAQPRDGWMMCQRPSFDFVRSLKCRAKHPELTILKPFRGAKSSKTVKLKNCNLNKPKSSRNLNARFVQVFHTCTTLKRRRFLVPWAEDVKDVWESLHGCERRLLNQLYGYFSNHVSRLVIYRSGQLDVCFQTF